MPVKLPRRSAANAATDPAFSSCDSLFLHKNANRNKLVQQSKGHPWYTLQLTLGSFEQQRQKQPITEFCGFEDVAANERNAGDSQLSNLSSPSSAKKRSTSHTESDSRDSCGSSCITAGEGVAVSTAATFTRAASALQSFRSCANSILLQKPIHRMSAARGCRPLKPSAPQVTSTQPSERSSAEDHTDFMNDSIGKTVHLKYDAAVEKKATIRGDESEVYAAARKSQRTSGNQVCFTGSDVIGACAGDESSLKPCDALIPFESSAVPYSHDGAAAAAIHPSYVRPSASPVPADTSEILPTAKVLNELAATVAASTNVDFFNETNGQHTTARGTSAAVASGTSSKELEHSCIAKQLTSSCLNSKVHFHKGENPVEMNLIKGALQKRNRQPSSIIDSKLRYTRGCRNNSTSVLLTRCIQNGESSNSNDRDFADRNSSSSTHPVILSGSSSSISNNKLVQVGRTKSVTARNSCSSSSKSTFLSEDAMGRRPSEARSAPAASVGNSQRNHTTGTSAHICAPLLLNSAIKQQLSVSGSQTDDAVQVYERQHSSPQELHLSESQQAVLETALSDQDGSSQHGKTRKTMLASSEFANDLRRESDGSTSDKFLASESIGAPRLALLQAFLHSFKDSNAYPLPESAKRLSTPPTQSQATAAGTASRIRSSVAETTAVGKSHSARMQYDMLSEDCSPAILPTFPSQHEYGIHHTKNPAFQELWTADNLSTKSNRKNSSCRRLSMDTGQQGDSDFKKEIIACTEECYSNTTTATVDAVANIKEVGLFTPVINRYRVPLENVRDEDKLLHKRVSFNVSRNSSNGSRNEARLVCNRGLQRPGQRAAFEFRKAVAAVRSVISLELRELRLLLLQKAAQKKRNSNSWLAVHNEQGRRARTCDAGEFKSATFKYPCSADILECMRLASGTLRKDFAFLFVSKSSIICYGGGSAILSGLLSQLHGSSGGCGNVIDSKLDIDECIKVQLVIPNIDHELLTLSITDSLRLFPDGMCSQGENCSTEEASTGEVLSGQSRHQCGLTILVLRPRLLLMQPYSSRCSCLINNSVEKVPFVLHSGLVLLNDNYTLLSGVE